ncbi:hypothetical protein [Pontiella sulfatireligans]|uniref:Uncharacterized protein n=1 Tax=Pontiella sulfatireligans TaxID=2750658 RepID=A0A6C2UP87_9BACT|nr:hypothetical protein [Pontiella sulfatireligans]VGO21081.1 hypothetical protein SCARR_03150 [Pontiella sulfatireligans]
MKGDIRQALEYLNENKVRVTYGAVQSYLGFGVLEKVNWEEILGPHRPYTSWVVSKKTGLPDGHQPTELHPDLLTSATIITKGKQLQSAVDDFVKSSDGGESTDTFMTMKERQVEVADCHGNNCAVICPNCRKAYLISGFLNKGVRSCPHCGKSKAVFKDVKAQWEETHQDDLINPEQSATRLTFKKEWLGYDVWVTFTEGDVTYRYPHDQLLQTFISRLGIIAGTKSWDNEGIFHFPRLSGEQKKMLQRYVEAQREQPVPTQAAETGIVIPEIELVDGPPPSEQEKKEEK